MPRRPGEMTPEEEAAERSVMSGFPEDGDEFSDGPSDPPERPAAPPAPAPDPLAEMQTRLDRMSQELAETKRLIPPAAPRQPDPTNAPRSAVDDVDWDKELFADPKGAIKKAISIARQETAQELRAEYQRDRGTTQFWDKFYALHPDLRQDHDLVEVTLNSNLSTLANIRVEDAYTKLAELTRERILRYAGGERRKPKARVEGGTGTPATPAPAPVREANEPTSMSDFIRARRMRRRASAA